MVNNKGNMVAKENSASAEEMEKVNSSDNVECNTEPGADEVPDKTEKPMIENEAATTRTEEEKLKEMNEGNQNIKKKKSKKRKSKKKTGQKEGEQTPGVSTGVENHDKKKSEASTGAKNDMAGLIFMCNSKTKEDCFRYHVFGLPKSQKDIVEKVTKGMKLFLYDFELRLMYGIYKARGRGGLDLQPNAFKSSERAFPAQVRFSIHKDCVPLPEDIFKAAIKENYYGKSKKKFKFELTGQQVKKLFHLFRPIPKDGRLGIESSSIAERRNVPHVKAAPNSHLSMPSVEVPRRYAPFSEDRYALNSYPRIGGIPGPITSPQPPIRGIGVPDFNHGNGSRLELLRELRRQRPIEDDPYLDIIRRDLQRESFPVDLHLRRDSLLGADAYRYFGGRY